MMKLSLFLPLKMMIDCRSLISLHL